MEINVHAAKTHFSKLLKRVAAGEEITIAKAGVPVARLMPVETEPKARKLGLARGLLKIASNFDAPLPGEVLDSFYGRTHSRRRK